MPNWTKDQAITFVINYLKSKFYTRVTIANRNKFGHAYITTEQGSFYWLYKRDQFHSFNYQFPNYIKKPNTFSGVGEGINFEFLKFALNNKAILLYSYERQPSAIYTPSREKLLNLLKLLMPEAEFSQVNTTALLKIYCDHYDLKMTQKRKNTYKLNDYTNGTIDVNEQTYCFPIQLMERFKGSVK